jgi:serine protease inhibitor
MSEPNGESDHPRVLPPSGDDESFRDYGRQVALDSLLELLLREQPTATATGEPKTTIAAAARPRRWRRWAALCAAISLLVLLAVGIRVVLKPHETPIVKREPSRPKALLAEPWQIEPTGDAEYEIVDPASIRLARGELRIFTKPTRGAATPKLTVETPEAKAIASGTDFMIGTHKPQNARKEDAMLKPLTRVLVLAGTVTLANAMGNISGGPDTLLAAEPNKAPTQIAVTANSDFGLDLYKELARQAPGKNVFFSPYSISSALAMAAEGARGSTADEMGKVLRFPAAARRIGEDAQRLPWNTAMIHTGMAELNRQLSNREKASPAIRQRIAQLRKSLAEAQERIEQVKRKTPNEYWSAVENGNKIANELNSLLPQVDQYELHLANGLWGEKQYPFRREFLDTLQANYATGGIALMDFQNAPDEARKEINAWCAKQTNGRIADVLPQGSITSNTRLVLANAIYFLGQWREPFDPNATSGADFVLNTNSAVSVPMMRKWRVWDAYGAFNGDGSPFETPAMYDPQDKDQSKLYPDAKGFLVAELPYKGGDLAMTVFVPRSPDGLGNLETLLTPAHVIQWLAHLKGRPINVTLPKFKLQTSYEMSKPLGALGMSRAFDAGKTDFSGITTADEPLCISAVFHKAFVEVNEKGTEAAAVTTLPMPTAEPKKGPPKLVPFVPEFKADRPFLFLIRDCKSGVILFLGRMTDPKAG